MNELILPLEKYDADTMKACIGKTLREIPKQVFDDFMRLRDEWKPSEPVDTGTCYSFQFRTKNGIPMEFEAKRHISRGIYMQTTALLRNVATLQMSDFDTATQTVTLTKPIPMRTQEHYDAVVTIPYPKEDSNEPERLDYRVGNKGYLKVLLHGLMVYKK